MYGPWRVERVAPGTAHHGEDFVLERGYWSGINWEPCFHKLVRNNRVWMSAGRMELESHAVHLKHARGTVVVCGVGMGLFIYNLCLKPQVTRIVAVDKDPWVIDMVRHWAESWPGSSKIVWAEADALEFNRASLVDLGVHEAPDYLYVDIWPTSFNDAAVLDTSRIQRGLLALCVGWWTQEFEFAKWCANRRVNHRDIKLDDFDRWCLDLDMAVHERSREYMDYCFLIMAQVLARVSEDGK